MDITNPADFVVSGNLHANKITVIQDIHIPGELPPKNVRFNVEKPIVTFTGREQFLIDLHRTIQQSRGQIGQIITVLTQAPLPVIAATGGVGKTETVRMYISQHGHEYDHVIWIDAEDSFLAKGQFQNLATKLKIPRKDNKAKPFDLIVKEVYEKLCQNAHSVLVVFDNAESLGNDSSRNGIREFLPGCLSPFFVEPTVLVTSRNQNWRFQKVIQLDLWRDEECVEFVLTQLNLNPTEENKSIALELGELFDRLPIAMQSAVSVILQECEENSSVSVTDAVKLLISDYKAGIMEVLASQPLNSSASASTTMISLWNISLKKIVIQSHGELAIKILSTMAYLSPASVPKAFLRSLFESPTVNKSSLAQALILLTNFSLITMYKKHFSMHRMIQDVTIQNLKTKIGASAEIIFSQNTFSDENAVLMRLSGQLYKHSMTLSSEKDRVSLRDSDILANYIHVSQRHLADKLATNNAYMKFTLVVADILREASDNERAIEMFTTVLEVVKTGETNYDSSSKLTLGIQTNMALALLAHGQYEKAEKVYTEIYNVKATTFGPGHLETLLTKSEIASMLHYQDKYESSKKMLLEVLEGFKSLNMTRTPEAIRNKHNLAGLHTKLGEYPQGLKLFEEVLQEIEAAPHLFKNSTKEIIIAKSNIASVLQSEGYSEEAENILSELTTTAEMVLGENHPVTSHVKGNYANTLSTWEMSENSDKQGKALDTFENLLQIQERLLGPEHPKTIYTKTRVADSLFKQGKTAEATKMSKNLFEISRSSNSCDSNPHIVENVKIHKATVLVREGKYTEGIRLYIEVLNQMGKVVGPKHPHIGKTQLMLAWAYIRKEEYENALRVCQYVLVLEKLLRGSLSETFMYAAKYFLTSLTEYVKSMYFGSQLDPSSPEDLVTLFSKIAVVDRNQAERYLHVSKWNIIFAVRRYFEVNEAESRKAICSVLETECSSTPGTSGSSLSGHSHILTDISGDIEIVINGFIEKFNADIEEAVRFVDSEPRSAELGSPAHPAPPADSLTLLNIIAYIPLADYCQLSLKLLEDILASSFNKVLLPAKLQLIKEASLAFVFTDLGTPDKLEFVDMHSHVQHCFRKRLDAKADFSYLLGVCKYFSQLGVDSLWDVEETILFLHEYLRERNWPLDSITYSIIFCSVLIRVYEKFDAAFTVAQDVLEFIQMYKNSATNMKIFVENDLNLLLLCVFTLSRSNQLSSKCSTFQSWTESILKQKCETALVSIVRPSTENAMLSRVESNQEHTYLFCFEKLKCFHNIVSIKAMDEKVLERVVSKILLTFNTPTLCHDVQSLDPMHGLLWRCFYKLYLWL